MPDFKINFLDHVAIRVSDLEKSASWYEKILGLKRHQSKHWGAFPIFLLSGKSGVALFPQKANEDRVEESTKSMVDHFAFNVSKDDFEKAKNSFNQLNIEYSFQDHYYFHSIYINDPDGHIVELTTLVVDANDFYRDEK